MGIKKSKKFILLLPNIKKLIDQGYTHETIIKDLNNSYGLDICLDTFRKYLYRYKKFNKPCDNDKILKNVNVEPVESEQSLNNVGNDQMDQMTLGEDEMTLAQRQGVSGDLNVVKKKAAALLRQIQNQQTK